MDPKPMFKVGTWTARGRRMIGKRAMHWSMSTTQEADTWRWLVSARFDEGEWTVVDLQTNGLTGSAEQGQAYAERALERIMLAFGPEDEPAEVLREARGALREFVETATWMPCPALPGKLYAGGREALARIDNLLTEIGD